MIRPRRALVLIDDTARHPFRQGLPPHLRHMALEPQPRWRFGASDLREFLMAYCACFLAVSTFLL